MPKPKNDKKGSPAPVVSWSEWFDRAAQVFDDPRMKVAYYKSGKTGEPYPEEAVRLTQQDIFNKLKPKRNHRLLDVGCGVGFFTKFFADKVARIVGTDVSPHMVKTASMLNPQDIFLVASADVLPFKGKLFDRIFSYGVTQYLPDEKTVQRMLDEMRRLLKSPGQIFIGDILEPVQEADSKSYSQTTPKSKPWWPESLDHNLPKLYLSKDFFRSYCAKDQLACRFFQQNIPGRSIPTPRYDVLIS